MISKSFRASMTWRYRRVLVSFTSPQVHYRRAAHADVTVIGYSWFRLVDGGGRVRRSFASSPARASDTVQLGILCCPGNARCITCLYRFVRERFPVSKWLAIGRSAAPRRNRQMRQANSIARKSLSGPRLLGIRQFLRVHGVINYAREEGIDCSHAIHVG